MAIPLFENITYDLTSYEKEILLPLFLEGFKNKFGPENAVTNKHIIDSLKKKVDKHNKPYKISDARVRKIISYIRINGLIEGLIATSKGYYVSNNPVEVLRYIDSLKARTGAINMVSDNMKTYVRKLMNNKAA